MGLVFSGPGVQATSVIIPPDATNESDIENIFKMVISTYSIISVNLCYSQFFRVQTGYQKAYPYSSKWQTQQHRIYVCLRRKRIARARPARRRIHIIQKAFPHDTTGGLLWQRRNRRE